LRLGLPVSLALHGAILGWALITIQSTPPLKINEPQPVEVAIISEDALVRLKQGSRDAKLQESQQSNKPMPETTKPIAPKAKEAVAPPTPSEPSPPPPPAVAKEEPPPPAKPKDDEIAKTLASLPPEPMPTPVPGPTPDDQKKLEEKLKQAEAQAAADAKAKADAKAAADAKAKADAKAVADAKAKAIADAKAKADAAEKKRIADEKKKFDTAKIAALLDKVKDKNAPAPSSADAPTVQAKDKGPTAGDPTGRDKQNTANQRSMIGTLMKQAVSRCWNINSGLEGVDKVVVELEVKLNPDGTLAQPPKIANTGSGPLFSDASNSAMRAVMQCAPYANLPAQFYKGGWDHMIVEFDPRKMF
jgi:colicin import membrane protein